MPAPCGASLPQIVHSTSAMAPHHNRIAPPSDEARLFTKVQSFSNTSAPTQLAIAPPAAAWLSSNQQSVIVRWLSSQQTAPPSALPTLFLNMHSTSHGEPETKLQAAPPEYELLIVMPLILDEFMNRAKALC